MYKKKDEMDGMPPEEIAMMPKPGWGSNGKVHHSDVDGDEEGCGLGSCRPSFLQRFKNIWTFTFVLGLSSLGADYVHVYLKAQEMYLRRQFEVGPSTTNWMVYSSEIAFILSVLFLSIFARRIHIPRILAISSLICALSALLCIIPFLATKGDLVSQVKVLKNETYSIKTYKMKAQSCIVNEKAMAAMQRLMMEAAAAKAQNSNLPVTKKLPDLPVIFKRPTDAPVTKKLPDRPVITKQSPDVHARHQQDSAIPEQHPIIASSQPELAKANIAQRTSTTSASVTSPEDDSHFTSTVQLTTQTLMTTQTVPEATTDPFAINTVGEASTTPEPTTPDTTPKSNVTTKTILIPDYAKLITHPNYYMFGMMSKIMGFDLQKLAKMSLDEQIKHSKAVPPSVKAMLPRLKSMLGPNADSYFRNVTVPISRTKRSVPRDGRVNLETDLAYSGQLAKMLKAMPPVSPVLLEKLFNEFCPFNSGPFLKNSSTGILKLFNVAMILQGIARAPRLAYAISFYNDNTKGRQTVCQLAVFCGIYLLGPLVSVIMSLMVHSNYVSFEDVGFMTAFNPRWLPAWWLGFIVMAAFSLSSIGLLFFPRKLKHSDEQTVADSQSETYCFSIGDYFTELLSSLFRLCTNLVYVCLLLGSLFGSFVLFGLLSVVSTYVTHQFSLDSFISALPLTLVLMCLVPLGALLGGIVSSKCKCSSLGNLKLALGVTAGLVVVYTLQLGLGCSQPPIDKGQRVVANVSNEICASTCPCSEFVFSPGCGSDGKTYYSPCFAGCGEGYDGKFHDCKCLEDDERTVTPGYCPSCDYLYPFGLVLLVGGILAGMNYVPLLIATFRSVNVKDIPLAIGLSSMLVTAVVFIASPIVYQKLVDAQCLHRHPECGEIDSCVMYDIVTLRYEVFGLSLGLQLLASLFLLVAFLVARKSSIFNEHMYAKNHIKS